MNFDINTIVLVVGFAITCATFTVSRKKAITDKTTEDTKELAEIHSDIKTVAKEVNSISSDLKDFKSNHREDIADIRGKYDTLLQKQIKLEMRVEHLEKEVSQ